MGNITSVVSESYSVPALGGSFPQPAGSAAMPFTATYDILVGWHFAQDGNIKIKINDLDTDNGYSCSIDRDSGSWIADGFAPATQVDVVCGDKNNAYWESWAWWPLGYAPINPFTANTVSVTEKTIILNIEFDPFQQVGKGIYFSSIDPFYSGESGGTLDYVFKFIGRPTSSYCRLKYCFFKGSSSQPNFNDFYGSPIYYAGALSNSYQLLSPIGQDLIFSSGIVSAIDVTGDYIPVFDSRRNRELYVRYTITDNIPWYGSEIANALESGTVPSMYSGSNSPIIAIEATIQKDASSPATSKIIKKVSNQGLVGWYNEGGNGIPMPSSLITNFEILQDLQPSDKVRRIGETIINFRVNSAVLEPLYFTVFADNYQLSPDSINAKEKQIFGQAGISTGGSVIIDSGILQSVTADYQSGYADIHAVLSITPDQAQKIGNRLCICASAPFLYNGELTAATKMLAQAELGGAADVEGLILSSSVLYTPNIYTGLYTAGSTNIEDSTVFQFQASLAPTAKLQYATFQWIAVSNDGKEQVIENKDVRFTAFSNGVISTNSPDYSLSIAFGSTVLSASWSTNIPWRGWLPSYGGSIDTINEHAYSQNGLCRDAGVYFENNCTIHCCLIITLYGEGSGQSFGVTGIGEYRLQSAPVRAVRYDENKNWSTVITCKAENGYVLPSGRLASKGKTIVESVNTWIGSGGIDSEYQCVLRIEPSLSISGGFDEVGNVLEKKTGSLWKSQFADIDAVGAVVICRAELSEGIDGDVKISSKIASKSGVPEGAKITEDNIYKFTEDENFKVIEQ